MFVPFIPSPVYNLCHCWVLFSSLCRNFSIGVRGVKRRGVVKEEAVRTLGSVDDEIVEFEVLGVIVSGDHRKDGRREQHTCGMMTSPRTSNRSSTETRNHSRRPLILRARSRNSHTASPFLTWTPPPSGGATFVPV